MSQTLLGQSVGTYSSASPGSLGYSPEPSSPFPQVEGRNRAESSAVGSRPGGQEQSAGQRYSWSSPSLAVREAYQDVSVSEHRKFKLSKVCIHLEIHLKACKTPLKTQMCSILLNSTTDPQVFFCLFVLSPSRSWGKNVTVNLYR